MFRIPSSYLYEVSQTALSVDYNRLAILQNELSTGIRVSQGADDPSGIGQATLLESKIDQISQYQETATMAQSELSSEQTQMNNYHSILEKIRELTIKASDGTSSAKDLKNYGSELKSYLSELLSVANAKNQDGKSMFAGTADVSPAYDVTKDVNGDITSVSYLGNDDQNQLMLSSGNTVSLYQSGNKIFGASGASIFDSVLQFAQRLSTGTPLSQTEITTQMNQINDYMKTSTENITTVTGQYNLADFEVKMNNSLSINYKNLLAKIKDADYPVVASELSKQLTILKATMAASEQLQKITMF